MPLHCFSSQEMAPKGNKIQCFEVIPDTVRLPCQEFTNKLQQIRKSMKMIKEEKDIMAVLFYLPIVSRAGTDIQAALQKIDTAYEDNFVALVVLHHTFDPECTVSDSSKAIDKENTRNPKTRFVVDCLFHEDRGLLQCRKNNDAVQKVADWLKQVKKASKKQKQTATQSLPSNESSRKKTTAKEGREKRRGMFKKIFKKA